MTSHHASGAGSREFRPDDLGPRPRIHHRRPARRKNRDAAPHPRHSANAHIAARSASNIATSRAKKKRTGSANRFASSSSTPEPLAAETKKELLQKLIEAEQFEQFLHKKYLGQKRFSLEGCETVIPMLDQIGRGSVGTRRRRDLHGHGPSRPAECAVKYHRRSRNGRHGRTHFHRFRRHVASRLPGRRRRREISPGRRRQAQNQGRHESSRSSFRPIRATSKPSIRSSKEWPAARRTSFATANGMTAKRLRSRSCRCCCTATRHLPARAS